MGKSTCSLFDSINKVVSLYVSVLAIIALMATIGIFSIRSVPKVEILKPLYIVNMTKIFESINLIEQKDIQNMFSIPSYLNGNLSIYGRPDNIYKDGNYKKYFLPYERVGSKSWQRSSDANPNNFFYRLGIENTGDHLQTKFNISANRTDDQKTIGLLDLIGWDRLEVAEEQKLECKIYQGEFINPLVKLKNMKDAIPDDLYTKLVTEFAVATKVYSIVSISNQSQAPMEKIRLIINDVIGTGDIKVVGWTAISPIVDLVSEGPNIRLNIERIDSEQSIEILLRGWKLIRDDEISISTAMFSGLNKRLILSIMIISFLLILILYLGDKFIIKRNRSKVMGI